MERRKERMKDNKKAGKISQGKHVRNLSQKQCHPVHGDTRVITLNQKHGNN